MRKKNLIVMIFLAAVLAFTATFANAQKNIREKDSFKAITSHLQTKYQAHKVKIPFLWLAKLAVKVVRPAGVKSFDVTLFDNLTFSPATLDAEMQAAMKNALGEEWAPIIRVRSKEGEQVYLYMRDEGANVRLMFVAIDKENATVVRAKFNADKFVEFINNPKIFGISLKDDKKNPENATDQPQLTEKKDN